MATFEKEVEVGGKGGVTLKAFPDMKQLSRNFAEFTQALAKEAIAKRGAFSIVLSGGSLVKALGTLAEPDFVGSTDWSKWHVFWADERKVDLTHTDSNYKAASEEFLSKVPIPSGQVYTINASLSVEACAVDYESGLRRLVEAGIIALGPGGEFPKFDLVCLGMGPDGHVASLFPHHPLLLEASKWVASIADSPKPPPERITLTYPVLNAASNIAFVATGSGKAEMLKLLFGGPAPKGSLPSQGIFPTEGKLYWFTDEAAVSFLRS